MDGFLNMMRKRGVLLKEISSLFFFVLILSSCEYDYKSRENYYLSNSKVDDKLRFQLLRNANDSILKWQSFGYEDVQYGKDEVYEIDSFFVFNNSKDRAVSAILEQAGVKSEVDYFRFLNCEKRNNKWYFFIGATVGYPRNCYNNPTVECTPIPMDTLRLHARRNLLNIYYTKFWPWSEEYMINEDAFKEEFDIAMGENAKIDWISGKSRKRLTDSIK